MNEPEIVEEPIEEIAFVDLTEPKTFTIGAFAAVLFGVMIGLGFSLIFTRYPNLSGDSKLHIIVLTLLCGIAIGTIPRIVVNYWGSWREWFH